MATLVTWSHGHLWELKITLTTIPFTLIGLPLAIFLGFCSNAAYDRFWEGRKLWGELVHRSRSLGRQCLSLVDDPVPAAASAGMADARVRMLCRAIALPTLCATCCAPSRAPPNCARCCCQANSRRWNRRRTSRTS